MATRHSSNLGTIAASWGAPMGNGRRRLPAALISRPCANCSVPVFLSPREIRAGGNYCSTQCHDAKRGREQVEAEGQVAAEYRDVEGFPGYRVGADGSVWSRRSINGRGALKTTWRRLKLRANRDGHLRVVLFAGGKRTMRYVHQLVLEAFVGPCPDGLECCHENGDPADNRLDNLRRDTRKNNAGDMVRHGRPCRGESHHSASIDEAQVRAIRAAHATGTESLAAIARRIGVSADVAQRVARRATWKHVV